MNESLEIVLFFGKQKGASHYLWRFQMKEGDSQQPTHEISNTHKLTHLSVQCRKSNNSCVHVSSVCERLFTLSVQTFNSSRYSWHTEELLQPSLIPSIGSCH